MIELHVPDFEKAKEFYGRLGFRVVWERQPDADKGYLVMRREDAILCFWSGNEYVYNHPYFRSWPKKTKRGYAVEIVIVVNDLENFYRKVKKHVTVVEELQTKPWGEKDFRIEDPFGFYVRFTEPYDVLDPAGATP